jgi:hypothetical protein
VSQRSVKVQRGLCDGRGGTWVWGTSFWAGVLRRDGCCYSWFESIIIICEVKDRSPMLIINRRSHL